MMGPMKGPGSYTKHREEIMGKQRHIWGGWKPNRVGYFRECLGHVGSECSSTQVQPRLPMPDADDKAIEALLREAIQYCAA